MSQISFLVAIGQIIYADLTVFKAIDDLFLYLLSIFALSTSFYFDLMRCYNLHFILINLFRFFISRFVAVVTITCVTFSRCDHVRFVYWIVICILFFTFCLCLILLQLGFIFFYFCLQRLLHTLPLTLMTFHHLLLFGWLNFFYLLLLLFSCYFFQLLL